MNYVGVDLGQARDHSAFAVVSRADYPSWVGRGDQRGPYLVRHVGRAPLGTPYPRVVEGVRRMVAHPQMDGQVVVVVDATGVGAPVVDMLRRAGLGCEVCAVTITGGGRESHAGPAWNVPKTDLMAGLRVLLETGELKIARELRETAVLVRELMDVQVSLSHSKEGRAAEIGYGGGRLAGI